MQSAACIHLLYHPAVQYSHCHILVAVKTYGEICHLLEIPVWTFMTCACLRLQILSTGEAGKRDAWARRVWFDTVPTPSQGRSFTPATGYQPYQCSDLHTVQAANPLRYSANIDQRKIVLFSVDGAEIGSYDDNGQIQSPLDAAGDKLSLIHI